MKKKLFILAFLSFLGTQAQNIKDSSIMVSAKAHPSEKKIILNWSTTDAGSYQINRKTTNTNVWDATLATVPGNINTFTDSSIQTGVVYEYRILKIKGNSIRAVSYVASGKDVALAHYKKNILILVDSVSHQSIDSNTWKSLINDYYMDGYGVEMVLVSENQTPPEIRTVIKNWYNINKNINKHCLLLGRIPVAYSGLMLAATFDLPPDAHPDHGGAWPTDLYYAEMDYDWTDNGTMTTNVTRDANKNLPGDGKFDHHFIPDDIDIQIGRVDFRNLPSQGNTDLFLLNQYLNKLHRYKTGNIKIPEKAFISDNFGYLGGEMPMRSGWNNASAIVGASNIRNTGNLFDSTKANTYLWTNTMGGGSFTNCSGVGNSAAFKDSVRAVFNVSFGSYFGDWNTTDNFLRSCLASKGLTLTNVWAHRPHWYFHQMAMGMPIGHSVQTSQNNLSDFSLASNYIGNFSGTYLDRRISMNLMGDPSLRLRYPMMPNNLVLTPKNSAKEVELTWAASNESDLIGYNIYRTNKKMGIYYLIGSVSNSTLTFTDNNPFAGTNYYVVKAVKMETSNCGTYLNSSLGITAQINNVNGNNSSIASVFRNNIKMYPNPNNGQLNIETELGTEVSVMDIQGKVILTFVMEEEKQSISTNEWNKGVYLLVFRKDNNTISEKLIVQ
jgi:hypothetical protein